MRQRPADNDMVRMFALLGFVMAASALAACGGGETPPAGAVHLLTYGGNVDPVMERYIRRGIDRAVEHEATAVVLKLDTPGGLLTTTRNIVRQISESPVPVIVWVAPAGAHAASAGTFITIAAHVAAMAPGTNIGAASPVSGSGEDIDGTLGKKVENDAVAFIRSIAEVRGRNADWAERAVREAVALPASEAVELNVVDFVASDLPDVLRQADGRKVEVPAGSIVLSTAQALTTETPVSRFERALAVLADPNVSFLLISLGGLLLLFGLLNAGTFMPETAGALMLVLGFFSLSVIPYNVAGVVLVGLGLSFLALEMFVPGTGALALFGTISLVLGGLFFTSSADPDFQVSRWLVVGIALFITGVIVVVLGALLQSRRLPVASGERDLIGRPGMTITPLDPDGTVLVQGERWNATAVDRSIKEGESVVVTGMRGLTLSVRASEPPRRESVAGKP